MEEFFPNHPDTVIKVTNQFHCGGMKNSFYGGLNGGTMFPDFLYGTDLTTGLPQAEVIGVFKKMNRITQGNGDKFAEMMTASRSCNNNLYAWAMH